MGIRPGSFYALAGAHILCNPSASWFVLGKHRNALYGGNARCEAVAATGRPGRDRASHGWAQPLRPPLGPPAEARATAGPTL